MNAIRPGMTRADLLTVFVPAGAISTRLQSTFASRECGYFKVDVQFEAAGKLERDSQGRLTPEEDPRDKIVKISRPYVEFPITD
jgi:hypothetical protein